MTTLRGAANEKLVFENTFTGLFRHGVQGRLSPAAVQKLAQLGVDLTRPLLPAYPLQTWSDTLEIVALELEPHDSRLEALRKLGRLAVKGYRQTLIGKAAEQLARIIGPKRTLARLTQNFRTSDNYTETTLTELSPGRFELWMNDVFGKPSYMAGVIEEILEVAGAKEFAVVPGTVGPSGPCTFQISWKP